MIKELDSLDFDQDKRRDFMIWLSRKFGVIAYAYATRVFQQAEWGGEPKEALLDIYASSLGKDAATSFSILRNADGSITYQRQAHFSEDAKDQRDEIFLGLHRSGGSASTSRNEEFEKVTTAPGARCLLEERQDTSKHVRPR